MALLLTVVPFLVACWDGAKPESGAATEPAAGHADEGGREEIPDTIQLASAAIAEAGVQSWTIKPVNLEHLLVLTGSVEPNQNAFVRVSVNVPGRLVEAPFDLGARVKKGDVVARVDSVELGRARAGWVSDLAALTAAERSLDRARRLLDAKAISLSEFQAREADHVAKAADAASAERSLRLFGETAEGLAILRRHATGAAADGSDPGSLGVAAPFDGVLLERHLPLGEWFEAQRPLVTIADLSTVWVFMQAHEKDLASLRERVPASIRADAWPQETFRGVIDSVGHVVDATTRTLRVRARVANRAGRLRPGMFVRAHVEVPEAYEGKTVVAVPQTALQTLAGRTVVFVALGDGRFGRRVVETGHTFEGFTEVYSGVRIGDVVVTEGSFVLKSEFARAQLAEDH